ncbi:hypothetical protein HAX54_048638 [Datura stramonium]|uniref:Uncharacterized protein n=1 Tax=Datura stramonium TaxID=4076 RepID=A0ABS8SUT0_DATST|nr:hypothetical protein [Datura stramonium]
MGLFVMFLRTWLGPPWKWKIECNKRHIHDLPALLNEKVEAFEAQLQSVVILQPMHETKEFQPLDYSLLVDVDAEEVDKRDVNHNSILELGRLKEDRVPKIKAKYHILSLSHGVVRLANPRETCR